MRLRIVNRKIIFTLSLIIFGLFALNASWTKAAYITGSESQWINNGNNIYYNLGNVGIGVTNPGFPLDVTGITRSSNGFERAGYGSMLGFSGTSLINNNSIGNGGLGLSSTASQPITFWAGASSFANERMRITSAGNIGIGTTNPLYLLDVNGNIRTGEQTIESANYFKKDYILSFSTGGHRRDIVIPFQTLDWHRAIIKILVTTTDGSVSPYGRIENVHNIIVYNNSGVLGFSSNDVQTNEAFGSLTSLLYIKTPEISGTDVLIPLVWKVSTSRSVKVTIEAWSTSSDINYIKNLSISNSYDNLDSTSVVQAVNLLGNVGIGATNPGVKLDVAGAFRNSGATTHSLLGGSGNVVVMADNTGTLYTGVTAGNWWTKGGDALTNDGTWLGSNNNFDLPIRTNNIERMRITKAGNVGIGTTTPIYRLEVIQGTGASSVIPGINIATNISAGTQRATLGFGLNSALTTGWAIGQSIANNTIKDFYFYDASTASYRMVISANGNVGIGTTNPTNKFRVAGGNMGLDNNQWFTFRNPGGTNDDGVMNYDASSNLTLNRGNDFYLKQSGNTQFTLTSGGNVGIGTTNPSALLDVRGGHLYVGSETFANPGSWASTINLDGSSHARILIEERSTGVQTALWAHTGGNAKVGTVSSHNFGIITGGTERVTINTVGNVGIGVTNPEYKLDLGVLSAEFSTDRMRFNSYNGPAGGVSGYGGISAGGTAQGTGIIWKPNYASYTKRSAGILQIAEGNYFRAGLAFYTNNVTDPTTDWSEAMRISSPGNVGIGATNPGVKLDVAGAFRNSGATTHSLLGGSGNVVVMADNTGTLYTGVTAGNWWTKGGDALANDSTWLGSTNNFDLPIITNNTERMRITKGGNINIATSSVILLPNGSSAIPSLSFVNNPTGGLFFNGTDIAIRSGSSNNIRFIASGNLERAYITGTGSVTTFGASNGNAVSLNSSANNPLYLNTNSTNRMTIMGNGNVGIGLTNPVSKLEVISSFSSSDSNSVVKARWVGGTMINDSTGVYPAVLGEATAAGWYAGNFVIGVHGLAGRTARIGSTNSIGIRGHAFYAENNSYTGLSYEGNLYGGYFSTETSWVSGDKHANNAFGLYVRPAIINSGSFLNHAYGLYIDSVTNSGTLAGNQFGVYQVSNLMSNYFAGNVGIGITNPTNKFQVRGGSIDADITGGYRINTNPFAYQNGGIVYYNFATAANDWAHTFQTRTANTNYDTLTIKSNNVGIGLTNPGTKLDISGNFRNSLATTHSSLGGSGNVFVMADNTGTLYTGTATGAFLPLAGGTMSGHINMGGNDISNIGTISGNKLEVAVIDPLYSIDGVTYSTYAASFAGGLKEEYVDRIRITRSVGVGVSREFEAVLNFDQAETGSDLWLWRQVVDFSPENVEALVTPYGQYAQVYYIIKDNQIIFRSDRPVAISYRLIGRRFDWRQWPTLAPDQSRPGYKVR